jgi:hypothetical protein
MSEEIPEVFEPAVVQALHRRLLAAKDAGVDPDPEDLELKERVMASPYAMYDRPWAPDEW